MTPEVWYSVHHSQFLFCLRFFDITLTSFFRVFFSFLGVPLGIFSCIQRRLSFLSLPFSRTVCLVSSEGSHDPRGLVPDISFAFHLVSFLEWHYADEPFLDFSNFVPSHPTPIPTPAPDFDGRIWFRVSFIVSLFLWLRDDWLHRFPSFPFPFPFSFFIPPPLKSTMCRSAWSPQSEEGS